MFKRLTSRRRILLFLIPVVALMVIAGAQALWPKPPTLVLSVSSPIDTAGHRAKVLVPQGWQADANNNPEFAKYLGVDAYFSVKSPETMLQRWLGPISPDAEGAVQLEVARRPEGIGIDTHDPANGTIEVVSPDQGLIGDTNTARRSIAGDYGFYGRITFHNTDQGAFKANYQAICMSFRFE